MLSHGYDKEEFSKLLENDKVTVKSKENSHQEGKNLKLPYRAARSKIHLNALEKLFGSICLSSWYVDLMTQNFLS